MSRSRTVGLTACATALVVLTGVGLLFLSRHDRDHFMVVAALQSAGYLVAVWWAWHGGSSRRVVVGIAVVAAVLRVPIVLAPPYLSADIYRYVWDGRLDAAGFNPYLYTPADPRLEGLRDPDIFPQVATKYAPSIYPPVAQAIFFAATRVSETVTAMKAAIVAFEVVTFVLLVRLLNIEGLPTARVVVYAWHPLPLWEFAGSGHIDAALIPLCVAALCASRRCRAALTGLFLAGASLVKLYPVVLLPALCRRWGWRLPAAFGAAMVMAYLPFINAGLQVLGFLPGYATQEGFDANGDGFYLLGLLRQLPPLAGLSRSVYIGGAVASLAALGAFLAFAGDVSRPPFGASAVLAASFMLLVSPHYPWYFAWLIIFACFIRSLALLWLTNACLLLYLVTGYVFLPDNRRLAIESMIYGPFAALALFDLWYHRRAAAIRSSRSCRPV